MNNRKKVTIISLDYDECADIGFVDIPNSHKADKELAKYLDYLLALLAACKNILMNLLNHLTVDSDVVEIYVGSARQDIQADEFCARKNNDNGSCFQNFAALCKDKEWTFRRFLLGDAEHNRPAGTTMCDRNLESSNDTTSKAKLIAAQLSDIEKNYAGQDVDIDFYFIDDDSKNIYHNELAKIYADKPLPASIRNFSLIKFDWYGHYGHTNGVYCGTLIFHTHITQSPDNTIQVIASEENCWKKFISFPPMLQPELCVKPSVSKNDSAIIMPLKPKKVVVISLGYDNCGAILFDEFLKACEPDNDRFTTSRNIMMKFLDRITSDADSVELYVGSERQDIFKNESLNRLGKRGSCFQNYETLCQEKNWTFRKFLLGDAQLGLPAGTTMHNKNVFSYLTKKNTPLVQAQLADIENNYCDTEVDIDFYFIDADTRNITHKELAKFYSKNPPCNKIRNFSLIKLDCLSYLERTTSSGILNFHTRISQSPDAGLQIIESKENIWDTFITPTINNRKKVTIFSLDYDGCGEILFPDIVNSHKTDKKMPDSFDFFLPLLTASKNILMNLLNHVSAGSDVVELYVGSARQDILADEGAAKQNSNNGLCFKNFEALCKDKEWTFRKLLLGDAEHNRPAGSTMCNRNLRSTHNTGSKAKLIEAQLSDIEKNYTGMDVDINFCFIDDDYVTDEHKNIYLNELAKIYAVKPLPASIRNFSLIQFDWYGNYVVTNGAYCGTLIFHTHISQAPNNPIQVIASEENCWKKFISYPLRLQPELCVKTPVSKNNLAISTPLKPKKVAVISLNYDNCGAILFDEMLKTCESDERIIKMIDLFRRSFTTSRNILMKLLDNISADADVVELYVGSDRQDISKDEYLHRLLKRGLCFQNYASLCQQKNWTFRKFLLGDAQLGLEVGTTMQNINVISHITGKMTPIIQAQLKDIENNYCDDEVDIDFYYIEADTKNINHNELAELYSKNLPCAKIRNFSLIKLDCFSYLNAIAPSGILNFHTCISQSADAGLQIIKSEENIWDTFIPQACDESLNETTPSSTMTILSVINNSHTHDNSSLVAETCNTNTQINSPETELSNEAQPSATDHAEDFPKIGCPSW
jgi:hypothetical protein